MEQVPGTGDRHNNDKATPKEFTELISGIENIFFIREIEIKSELTFSKKDQNGPGAYITRIGDNAIELNVFKGHSTYKYLANYYNSSDEDFILTEFQRLAMEFRQSK